MARGRRAATEADRVARALRSRAACVGRHVLRVARQRARVLKDALLLGERCRCNWPSASHAPLPSPDDDIHAWMEWMNGENPAFRRWRERSMPPAAATRLAPTSLRFDQSHAVAIRFTMARTGRDVVGELKTEAGGRDVRLGNARVRIYAAPPRRTPPKRRRRRRPSSIDVRRHSGR